MKLDDYKNIWLFAEHRNDKLLPVFRELLAKAKRLSDVAGDCRVCALLIGSGLHGAVKEAEDSGVELVYYIDDEKLLNYNCESYAAVLESVITEYKPSAFLFGATEAGSELAPTVAARLKTGLASHCVDITSDKSGALTFIVPAFGGKVAGEILIPDHRPQMATVRPGIFDADKPSKARDVQTIGLKCPDLPDSRISFVSFTPAEAAAQNLEEADLVIGCGRGVGTDMNFQNLEKLAKRLNAPIAFTRPAIDMGWAPDESDMVGSSGKTIKPKVYLGFGISGATHHLCGINKSGTIISVNKDGKSKMFDMSDFKIIADSAAIVNALLKALN